MRSGWWWARKKWDSHGGVLPWVVVWCSKDRGSDLGWDCSAVKDIHSLSYQRETDFEFLRELKDDPYAQEKDSEKEVREGEVSKTPSTKSTEGHQ